MREYNKVEYSQLDNLNEKLTKVKDASNKKYRNGYYLEQDFTEIFEYSTIKKLESVFLETLEKKRNANLFRFLTIESISGKFLDFANVAFNNHFDCSSKFVDFFRKFSDSEMLEIILKNKIDFSKHYNNYFSKFVNNKEFMLELLEKNNFGPEHDARLISNYKSFFYNDSYELREIILNKPIIYDKLAKAGNKPNFSDELLKQLIYIHGSEHFVSRLSQNLKNDNELMQHIIIDNPINLFRGNISDYKKNIKDNAFFLFSDSNKSMFNIYGMSYILDHTDQSFLDFENLLSLTPNKHSNKEVVKKVFNDFLDDDQKKRVALRGYGTKEYYEQNYMFFGDVTLKKALEQCFFRYKIEINDATIENLVTKFQKISDNNKKSNVGLAYNITMAYKNNTLDEYLWLANNVEKENKNFVINFNTELLSKEEYEKLGLENVIMMAHYPYSFFMLSQLKKENLFDLYSELLNFKLSSKFAPAHDVNVLLYTCYTYSDAINDLKDKNQLNPENITKLINITKNNKLIDVNTADDVLNYENNLNKFCDKNIKKCEDVNYAKELLFARILKTNRKNAQDIILKYKQGLKETENQNYEILDILQMIDAIHDIDSIKIFYNKIIKLDIFDKNSIQEFEEHLKKEMIGDNYTNCSKLKPTNSTNRGILDDYKDIYDNTFKLDPNEPFDILIHAMGAYGENPSGQSLKDVWNTKEYSYSSGICTTLINNSSFQNAMTYRDNQSIIFGFLKNLSSNEILGCGPYDLYSRSDRMTPDSIFQESFHNGSKLIENCRNARGNYNEVVITRYHNDEKRQPDYIICMLYQTTLKNIQDSINVAKEFGIPMVLIDEEEFFKVEVEKHEKMYEEYLKNPNLNTAKNLFVQFENIKFGYQQIREKFDFKAELYFETKSEHYYDTLRSDLKTEQDKKIFDAFIENEFKKRNLKDYKNDQEQTLSEQKSKFALENFNDLRKKYGLSESFKIAQLQRSLNEYNFENFALGEGGPKKM